MSDSDLHQRVLAAFQTEFKEQMQAIRAMLAAWPYYSGMLLDEAFRMAHSMKGSARVCDLNEVEDIAHQLEHTLSQLTKGEISATPEVKERISSHADAAEDAMALAMERELATYSVETEASPAPMGGHDTLRIESVLLEALLLSTGQLLTEAARQESLEREMSLLARELEQLRSLSHQDRLDEGDLRFQVREAGKHLQQIRTRQQQGSRSLRVLSSRVQENVGHICMVPISSMCEGFPKMMRDLSGETGKPARFTMTGTENRADRAVLQALKDPVMHALRNAISHGIEGPARRRAAGKPEAGDVRMHMDIDGHFLRLTISDDGGGVDVEQVKQKAIRAGLLTVTEAEQQTAEAITDLIFHAGLSTAAELTTVSGRGVGLSVVRERVSQFQGQVKMTSRHGLGSSLEIRVPVSISARRLLLLRAAGRLFALPLNSIKYLRRVDDLHVADGRSMVFIDGGAVQVITAAEAAGTQPLITRDEDGKVQVAVLQGEKPLALHVEAVIGEFHALIRPLPYPASRSPHFSGAIVTEEGQVVLVLNTLTLADRSRATPVPENRQKAVEKPRQATVLVVDDSFTARTLQKSILETAGYHVRIAEDGRAALKILHAETVALVVSDIQMPHLDGFGLLSTMKSQPALADIPLILVTSLSSQEDQERGLALGADAYIVKERFDHQELLSVVRQLV
ncbi:two-component system chemotaxis sensor kinase CheA [Prosthecobacter fusiformis]|uniref:histidine kinase n=1 Tax=Prosthecobacter fusiformis TaxID=48464 RepID=A0A4R7RZP3_9BACT|nr:response regulator [Prosthecobacter fusiformis]TDU71341.1 two-component system chemotaxis sensor kinase CheA [Prosthecobacter fusiformis]